MAGNIGDDLQHSHKPTLRTPDKDLEETLDLLYQTLKSKTMCQGHHNPLEQH